MPKSVKAIAYENINVPGIFDDVLDEILEPALDKLVKGTETPLDDVLKAAIYPTLAAALKVESKKLWDKLMVEAAVVPVVGV